MSSKLRVVTPMESQDPLLRSQTLASFQTQKSLAKKVATSTGGRILKTMAKIYCITFPHFPQKTPGFLVLTNLH